MVTLAAKRIILTPNFFNVCDKHQELAINTFKSFGISMRIQPAIKGSECSVCKAVPAENKKP